MSNEKKKIYVGEKELQDSLIELFMKLSIEYISDGDGSEQEYHLFGEDDSSKSIAFEKQESLKNFLEKKGRAIINPGFCRSDLVKLIVDRFFYGSGSIDPSSTISEFLDENYTLKVSNPMNLGYFQDLITENAVVQGFNFVIIRNYLNSVLNFCSYLKHGELGELPFDIDYGYSESTYYIQVILNIQNFLLDNLMESIQGGNVDNPYHSAIKVAYENSHLMNVFSMEKGSKLCFCAVWSKEIDQEEEFFPTFLAHELYTLAEIAADKNLASQVKIERKNLNDDRVGYPGMGAVNFVDEDGQAKNNNAVLIKRVVRFLDDARFEAGEDLALFTEEHYRQFIPEYPNQENLKRLEQEDINLIIECLNNEKKADSLKSEVQVIKDNLEDDDYAEKIMGSLDSLEEEVQVISGMEDEDDHAETVSGGEGEEEGFTRVKGSNEEDDDGKFVIKGGKGSSKKKDVWKVKGLRAASKIKEEVKRLKGEGASVSEINMKVKSIVEEEFEDDKEGAQLFFENLSDDAADQAVAAQEIQKSSIFDDVHVDIDIELPDDDDAIDPRKVTMLETSVRMRDQQLGKMKKLLDRMKREVDRERESTAQLKDVGGTGVSGEKMREYIAQATELKNTVMSLEKEVVTAKNISEQERKAKEIVQRNAEREKEILLNKLERYEGTTDGDSEESISQIKKNNESLTRQVDELKKRISTVLDNTKKSQDEMVSVSEYNRVKSELSENITKLSDAIAEKKEASDASKALAFKLRAAEQRIKSYSGKLEKVQNAAKSSGDGGADPKSAHRVKHLEKTNERLQALNKKVSDELAEKKTELHKSKMESKTLEAKVKELEKKLEKKAA